MQMKEDLCLRVFYFTFQIFTSHINYVVTAVAYTFHQKGYRINVFCFFV